MDESTAPDDVLMHVLNLIATVPSLIGSAIMVYFCSKHISTSISIRIILPLAIADFFYSISNLMVVFRYFGGSLTWHC